MNFIYVLILLYLPCEIPSWVPLPERWSELKEIAWQLELTGPHCSWIKNWRKEVLWVRQNWKKCEHAPSIRELDFCPSGMQALNLERFHLDRAKYFQLQAIMRPQYCEFFSCLAEDAYQEAEYYGQFKSIRNETWNKQRLFLQKQQLTRCP
jgi:hypothetical protein